MVLEIIWSKRAEKGFDSIVKYLEENWTEREIKNFIKKAGDFFELLKKNPKILQASSKSNLRRGADEQAYNYYLHNKTNEKADYFSQH